MTTIRKTNRVRKIYRINSIISVIFIHIIDSIRYLKMTEMTALLKEPIMRESHFLKLRIENDKLYIGLKDTDTDFEIGIRLKIDNLPKDSRALLIVNNQIVILKNHLKSLTFGHLYGMSAHKLNSIFKKK